MKKALKKIGICILCMPAALIMLYICFEAFGAAYNSAAARSQTNNAVKEIERLGIEIIDSMSYSGNTTGTGNHADILSLIVVRADSADGLSGYCGRVIPACEFDESEYILSMRRNKLDIPEKREDIYILEICERAPFADNITGH